MSCATHGLLVSIISWYVHDLYSAISCTSLLLLFHFLCNLAFFFVTFLNIYIYNYLFPSVTYGISFPELWIWASSYPLMLPYSWLFFFLPCLSSQPCSPPPSGPPSAPSLPICVPQIQAGVTVAVSNQTPVVAAVEICIWQESSWYKSLYWLEIRQKCGTIISPMEQPEAPYIN